MSQRPKISALSLRNRHAGASSSNVTSQRFQHSPVVSPQSNHERNSTEQAQHQVETLPQQQQQQRKLDIGVASSANETAEGAEGVDPRTLPPVVDAYDLPPHVRHSAQDIKNLFLAAFGPVHSVVVVDPVRGHARVQFLSAVASNICLGRIIQHEEIDDESDDEDDDDDDVVVKRHHPGQQRRKGYVFLGYYRIQVEGRIVPQHLLEHHSAVSSGLDQRDGRDKLRRHKRQRSTSRNVDGDDDDDSAGSSLSGKHDESDLSESDNDDDEQEAPLDQQQGLVEEGESEVAEKDRNCLVLLRIIELPVDAAPNNKNTSSQQPHHSLSGLLSPLVVYQMLRDVCLPLKIVLCKKQQAPAAAALPSSSAQAAPTRSRPFESRNVLVQLDKHESVSAVIGAFNGTVVELMEDDIAQLTELSSAAAADTSQLPPQQVQTMVRVGANPQATKLTAPLQGQPPKKRVVAARFRVLACESRQDSGRPNELNVPVNIAGCMSISKQTIMKMGGIFDRSWVTPALTAAVVAASSLPAETHEHQRNDERRATSERNRNYDEDDDDVDDSDEESDDNDERDFVDHGKFMVAPGRYSPPLRHAQQHVDDGQQHRPPPKVDAATAPPHKRDRMDEEEQHQPRSRSSHREQQQHQQLPPPHRGAFTSQRPSPFPVTTTRYAHPSNTESLSQQPKSDHQHPPSQKPHPSSFTQTPSQLPSSSTTMMIRVGGVPLPTVFPPSSGPTQQQQQAQQSVRAPITIPGAFVATSAAAAIAPPLLTTVRIGAAATPSPLSVVVNAPPQAEMPPRGSAAVPPHHQIPSPSHLPQRQSTASPRQHHHEQTDDEPTRRYSREEVTGRGYVPSRGTSRNNDDDDDEGQYLQQRRAVPRRDDQRDRYHDDEHHLHRNTTVHSNNVLPRNSGVRDGTGSVVSHQAVKRSRRSEERDDNAVQDDHYDHHAEQQRPLSLAGDRHLRQRIDAPRASSDNQNQQNNHHRVETHHSVSPRLSDTAAPSRQQAFHSLNEPHHHHHQQQRLSQQQLRPPPPPPPREDWASADALEWEAVYSDEFQRTYFVGYNPYSGQQITSWDLPKGARLTSSR